MKKLLLLITIALLSCTKKETVEPTQHITVGRWTIYIAGSIGQEYSYKVWAIGLNDKIVSGKVDGVYSLSMAMEPVGYYTVTYRDIDGTIKQKTHSAKATGFELINDTIPATIY